MGATIVKTTGAAVLFTLFISACGGGGSSASSNANPVALKETGPLHGTYDIISVGCVDADREVAPDSSDQIQWYNEVLKLNKMQFKFGPASLEWADLPSTADLYQRYNRSSLGCILSHISKIGFVDNKILQLVATPSSTCSAACLQWDTNFTQEDCSKITGASLGWIDGSSFEFVQINTAQYAISMAQADKACKSKTGTQTFPAYLILKEASQTFSGG